LRAVGTVPAVVEFAHQSLSLLEGQSVVYAKARSIVD
jgi:hypothetical protein